MPENSNIAQLQDCSIEQKEIYFIYLHFLSFFQGWTQSTRALKEKAAILDCGVLPFASMQADDIWKIL